MARKDNAAAGGSEMKKFYLILGLVAVIGIGVVGYSVGSSAFGSAVSEPVDVAGLDDPATLVQKAEGVEKGDADAPIIIREFADYQCPACGDFALRHKPQIEMAYVDEGVAKLVFHDFPLTNTHAHAFLASRAARCAGDQDAYWEYHDHLFQNQGRWSSMSNPTSSFVDYAEAVGVDAQAFEECLRSDRHADVVTANMRLGNELGVPGTPTILVSRGRGMVRRLSSYSFSAVRQAVEALQAEAGEAPGS